MLKLNMEFDSHKQNFRIFSLMLYTRVNIKYSVSLVKKFPFYTSNQWISSNVNHCWILVCSEEVNRKNISLSDGFYKTHIHLICVFVQLMVDYARDNTNRITHLMDSEIFRIGFIIQKIQIILYVPDKN